MALTTQQMISLGFKPSKRSSLYDRKYDTLVYPITETDFLYIGYNEFSKKINNKILWKSFKQVETGERITYPVIHLGETGYSELKDYLDRSNRTVLLFHTEDCIADTEKFSVEGEVSEKVIDVIDKIDG